MRAILQSQRKFCCRTLEVIPNDSKYQAHHILRRSLNSGDKIHSAAVHIFRNPLVFCTPLHCRPDKLHYLYKVNL